MRKLPHHELVGWVVGNKRWPMCSAHPDCWQTPWKGKVLSIASPEAWTNSIAFPNHKPTEEETTAHVRQLINSGFIPSSVPVLWSFEGDDKQRVSWELVDNLRSYEADVAEWEAARSTHHSLRIFCSLKK